MCQQCKDKQFKDETGSWPAGAAFNRWTLWGCTCDPATVDEKVAELRRWTD